MALRSSASHAVTATRGRAAGYRNESDRVRGANNRAIGEEELRYRVALSLDSMFAKIGFTQ